MIMREVSRAEPARTWLLMMRLLPVHPRDSKVVFSVSVMPRVPLRARRIWEATSVAISGVIRLCCVVFVDQ